MNIVDLAEQNLCCSRRAVYTFFTVKDSQEDCSLYTGAIYISDFRTAFPKLKALDTHPGVFNYLSSKARRALK